MTHYNRFSIDSTYAQLYFDANIETEAGQARAALEILGNCCQNDKRRAIHFVAFASRVKLFCQKYPKEAGETYVSLALSCIEEGLSGKGVSFKNKQQLEQLKRDLEQIRDQEKL